MSSQVDRRGSGTAKRPKTNRLTFACRVSSDFCSVNYSSSNDQFNRIKFSMGSRPVYHMYCNEQEATRPPHPISFSENIITLHPDSAVARRIMYSQTISKPCPFTAGQMLRESQRLLPSRKRVFSACPESTSTRRNINISSNSSSRSKHRDDKRKSSSRFMEDASSLTLTPGLLSSSSSSLYWNDTRSSCSSQGDSDVRFKSAPILYPADTLSPTTRAHFAHQSLTTTWNQEHLFKAVIDELNMKYFSLMQFIDLQPPKQFMIGLFYTLPWKDITFDLFFREVEKCWVEPVYHRYRRAFVCTCMLYGGTT